MAFWYSFSALVQAVVGHVVESGTSIFGRFNVMIGKFVELDGYLTAVSVSIFQRIPSTDLTERENK